MDKLLKEPPYLTPLHSEIEKQIGALIRNDLAGHALALLNRCSQIIKGFEERVATGALVEPASNGPVRTALLEAIGSAWCIPPNENKRMDPDLANTIADQVIGLRWMPARSGPSGDESAPLTKSFVQEVPDKCDRIVWRNRYYHLPLESLELADCTLCAATPTEGFYTGCMVKDGGAPGWSCDGKGKLVRWKEPASVATNSTDKG